MFLQKALDLWFYKTVKKHCQGYCEIIRYADFAIAVFQQERDARRFLNPLPLRLEKFGLCLNEEKTQLLCFGRNEAKRMIASGMRRPTLDFLGLTHYWGLSKAGRVRLKRKTSKRRLWRSLVAMNEWLCNNRNMICQIYGPASKRRYRRT